MANLILSVTGSDRPGLTQALAAAVLSAGGNWLESHLSRLGGLYVGSVLVEAGDLEALRAAVQSVDAGAIAADLTAQGKAQRIAEAVRDARIEAIRVARSGGSQANTG